MTKDQIIAYFYHIKNRHTRPYIALPLVWCRTTFAGTHAHASTNRCFFLVTHHQSFSRGFIQIAQAQSKKQNNTNDVPQLWTAKTYKIQNQYSTRKSKHHQLFASLSFLVKSTNQPHCNFQDPFSLLWPFANRALHLAPSTVHTVMVLTCAHPARGCVWQWLNGVRCFTDMTFDLFKNATSIHDQPQSLVCAASERSISFFFPNA